LISLIYKALTYPLYPITQIIQSEFRGLSIARAWKQVVRLESPELCLITRRSSVGHHI